MSERTRFTGCSIVLVLLVGFLSVSAQSKDPLLGTWKQNVEKSKCIIPASGAPCDAPPRVPTTRVFEDLGGGFVLVSNDGVDAEGNPTGNRIIFRRDGKDYPIAARDQPGLVTISFTTKSVNPFVTQYMIKLDGEVLSTSAEELSADGKTYTTTTRGTNIRGQTVFNTTVFERMPSATK